jgi:hypothetical protein
LRNTDKYSAVFTEYSVAEYSAGHYSAEYLADRIVGRSLVVCLRALMARQSARLITNPPIGLE